ncbi:unnamed protein product [Mycena citricolor]|uniref:Uncharacterized protein n=1 Tax=Mycena citricolor TaxID=2018698 RepID=A0AAD2K7U7_9AGAR|nr:unnamed protein product [Mycena citricolor]
MKQIRQPLVSVSRKVKNSAKKLSTRFTRWKRSGFLWAVELEGTRTSLRSTVREMRPFPRRHFAFAPGERGNQHETLGAQIQEQEAHTAYSLKLSEVTTHDLASSNISESAQSGSDALLQFQLLHNLVPTFELQTDALEVSLALCPDIPGLLSTIHAHQNILDPTNPTSSLLESPRSEATDLLQKQGVAQLEVWRTDMQGSERRQQVRVLIAFLRQHLPGLYVEAPLSKSTRTLRKRAREFDDDEGGDDRHGKRSRVGAPEPGRSGTVDPWPASGHSSGDRRFASCHRARLLRRGQLREARSSPFHRCSARPRDRSAKPDLLHHLENAPCCSHRAGRTRKQPLYPPSLFASGESD